MHLERGLGILVSGLAWVPTLRTLDVSCTAMPEGELKPLTQRNLPSFLNLSDCSLTSAHIDELTETQEPDNRLQALWITNNPNLDENDYARLLRVPQHDARHRRRRSRERLF